MYIFFSHNIGETGITSNDSEPQKIATGKKYTTLLFQFKKLPNLHEHIISVQEILQSTVLVEDMPLALHAVNTILNLITQYIYLYSSNKT